MKALAAGLALALVTLGAGCGAEEKLTEAATEEVVEQAIEESVEGGSDVELDVDDGGNTVTYESEEGSLTMGSGEIPESFPDTIPLPPEDYSILSAMEVTGDGGYVRLVVTTTGTVEDLGALMEQGLEEGGFTIEGTQNQSYGDTTSVMMQGTGDGKSVMITVNDAGDGEGQISVGYTITAAES